MLKSNECKLLLFILLIILVLAMVSCQKSPKNNLKTDSYSQHNETYNDTMQTHEIEPGETIKYQYHWLDSSNLPPVSIVIDDFGQISGELLQQFAELNESVTFSILPDLPNTTKTAQLANIYGHEVILHIPMQAKDTSQNPGKVFIKPGMDKDEIKDIMNGFIKQVPQAVGANNHMGSGVTADYEAIFEVMSELKRKGLFFLDSKTTPDSKVPNAARDLNMDYIGRDIFLDVPDVSNATLNKKLQDLEKYRGRQEPVIIITHCHNKTKLEALRSFINQLQGLGIDMIPLSDAVKKFHPPV